jgi:hypothetical protein
MADKQDENESNKRVIYTYPMVKQVSKFFQNSLSSETILLELKKSLSIILDG